MPRYRFLAYATDGQALRGALEGRSADDVVRRLQADGRFPVEVAEAPEQFLPGLLQRLRVRQAPPADQIVRFTEDLAALLRAGLVIDRAFGLLEDSYRGRPLAPHVEAVHDRLRRGMTLAGALARDPALFPLSYTSVVDAGERAGALPLALDRLAASLARAQRLRETIRSALVYPAVLLVLAAVSIVIVLTVIVPEFRPMLEDAPVHLALSTRLLLAFSDLAAEAWWCLPLAVIGLAVVVSSLRGRPGVRLAWDRLALRLPLLRALVLKSDTVRLCETLATLLGNGVAMTTAVASTAETLRNGVLKARLMAAIAGLKEGQGLARPLERHRVLPAVAVQLIRIGEETGTLPSMLENAAALHEREVRLTVDRLMKLLVPAIIVLLGGFIGAVIATVFSTMMNLNDLAV